MEDIYSKIYDWDNIYSAYLKARKCKRYKDEILKFSYNIENNLINIHYNLLNKKYIHGRYYEFVVNDSKKRIIRAAPFKDRIIHHCLCNMIEPIFDKKFIFDSYACRKGKGLHKAIKRFREFLRIIKLKNNLKNYDNIYCLKCDIVKYFDSVDQKILYNLIQKQINNKDILWLIEIILNSYKKGLPIGNLTSQLFANIYLHELDFYVKNSLGSKCYIRYMDDFIILDTDKQKLWKNYKLIKEFVLTKLKLEIEDKKTKLIPIKNGVVFLGFVILVDKLKLKNLTVKRFKKKIMRQIKDIDGNYEKIVAIANKFSNWKSYYSNSNSYLFIKRLYCKICDRYDHNIWEWGNIVNIFLTMLSYLCCSTI